MKGLVFTAVAIVILVGSGVRAHHSHTDFLVDRDTTLAGVIEGIQFQNPHVLIRLRTADATRYTAEWQGAEWLHHHPEMVSPQQRPVGSDTLKAGDRIVVVGSPARDSSLHVLVNLKEVRRLADGWTWKAR